MTLEEALRSTRVEREIGNPLRLLAATYSAPSENRLNESLEKLQTHTHRLSDIAEYLASLKYAKARDHRDEVLNKCSDEVFNCLLYTSPSPRDRQKSRMPSSA